MAKGKKKGSKNSEMWGGVRDAILPRERVSFADSRFEPASLAQYLSAERLHSILRSAENGQTQDLFAVYRDMILGSTHLQAEFSKRKLAVLKQPINFSPRDPKSREDVRACELVKFAWDETKGKMDALTHLLDSCLYPVSLLEKTYRPSNIPGLRFEWGSECGGPALTPVAYHLLDFTEGRLRLQATDEDTKMPMGNFFDPLPVRFVTHRGHLLTSIPDNWGGPMRAALFWWLFATMDRGWWVRFLERFGAPFAVAKYEDGREDTRLDLQRAFSQATKLFGLVVTKGTEIELIQSNSSQTGDAFEKFKATADRELSKLILGQTMTTEAQSAGMGSSQAAVHNDVRGDYAGFDATKLAETLQDQLIDPFLALNALPGRCRIIVGQEDPGTAEETLRVLEVLPKAGLELAEGGLAILSRRLSLPIVRMAAAPADPAGALPVPGGPPAGGPVLPPAGPGKKALAGIQIQAAQRVLAEVTSRQTSPAVARQLLIALGFDPTDAEAMIADAGNFKPVATLSTEDDLRAELLSAQSPGLADAFGQSLAALQPVEGQSQAAYQAKLGATLLALAPHRAVRALEAALATFAAAGA